MNSFSNETQQNANSLQENSKIADIYHRMLLGDKSALSNLQKIKINTPKQFLQSRIRSNNDEQSLSKKDKKDLEQKNQDRKAQDHTPKLKDSSQDRIKLINSQTLEQYMFQQNSQDRHKQKLRSYIKKKVNELRTEKKLLKNQEERQIYQIKKITQNMKLNTVKQSQSYDLVKKKKTIDKTANFTNAGINAKNQKAKIGQNFKKSQLQHKSNTNNQLPPLKQKKKISTQNSEPKEDFSESKILSRKNVRTPINLADSTLKVQLKAKKNLQNLETNIKDSPMKAVNFQGSELRHTKNGDSRMKKISLLELRKMREEFAAINQIQKRAQLEMMQYHRQTKQYVEAVKIRNQLNYRNQDKLDDLKKCLNPEPILNSSQSKKQISVSKQQEKNKAEPKNKRPFEIQQQKVSQALKDIKLIDEAIEKKKTLISKIQQKLDNNLMVEFWKQYDLQNCVFDETDQFEQEEGNASQLHSRADFKFSEAYSTSMPQTKDKKWKQKTIKIYDTNRSFQEYAKSRSRFKQSQIKNKEKSLNQIDQTDQSQDNGQNKVTVNSRLKKLLLQ